MVWVRLNTPGDFTGRKTMDLLRSTNGQYEITLDGAPCKEQVFILQEVLSTEHMWPTGMRAVIVRVEPPWRKEWETSVFKESVHTDSRDIMGLAEGSIDATFDQWFAKDEEDYFPVEIALFNVPLADLPHFIQTGNLAELFRGSIRSVESLDETSPPLQQIW